jgi:hypothetical protein
VTGAVENTINLINDYINSNQLIKIIPWSFILPVKPTLNSAGQKIPHLLWNPTKRACPQFPS